MTEFAPVGAVNGGDEGKDGGEMIEGVQLAAKAE